MLHPSRLGLLVQISAYHRNKLGQVGNVLDVDGAQAVRGNEKQRHVNAAVLKA